ncbi:MAG: hypothetical protein AAFZ65_00260 [Planctomycetota bacterium]
MPFLRPPLSLGLAALVCAAPASAQDGEAREPGTLDKAYEALVGDGTDTLRVEQPLDDEPRPIDPTPKFRPTPGEWFFEGGAFAEQYGDLDPSQPDEFQVRRTGVSVTATRLGERGSAVGAAFNFEATNFQFDDVTPIFPGAVEPVEDVFRGQLQAFWRGDQSGKYGFSAGGTIEAAGEAEAEFGDSITFQAFGATSYRVDDDLQLTFGALVRTALEDDVLAIPVFGVEWSIDDRNRLFTRGPTLQYEHQFDLGKKLYTNLAFQSREYRLDGQGPLPGAAFSDRELRLVGGVEFRPGLAEAVGAKDSFVQVYTGLVAFHQLTFFDDNENELFELEQDGTFLLGARLRLVF